MLLEYLWSNRSETRKEISTTRSQNLFDACTENSWMGVRQMCRAGFGAGREVKSRFQSEVEATWTDHGQIAVVFLAPSSKRPNIACNRL